MRVINVVSFDNGSLNEIESFGVFEEQLVDDVVEVALLALFPELDVDAAEVVCAGGDSMKLSNSSVR